MTISVSEFGHEAHAANEAMSMASSLSNPVFFSYTSFCL